MPFASIGMASGKHWAMAALPAQWGRRRHADLATALSFVPTAIPFVLRRGPQTVVSRNVSSRTRMRPQAKFNVDILTLGKRTSKDAVYDEPIGEYTKRMRSVLHMTERHVKRDGAGRVIAAARDNGASVMVLHAEGDLPRDSVHFGELIFKWLDLGRGKVVIVIGDADGLPDDVLHMKGPRVNICSLSTLTLTHKMVSVACFSLVFLSAVVIIAHGYTDHCRALNVDCNICSNRCDCYYTNKFIEQRKSVPTANITSEEYVYKV